MSDLWSEAAAGAEAEQLNREYVAARAAAEGVWDFLAQATSGTDYANRKGLMEARLDAIVAENAPSHSLKVRARLEAEFDKRVGKKIAANRKTAADDGIQRLVTDDFVETQDASRKTAFTPTVPGQFQTGRPGKSFAQYRFIDDNGKERIFDLRQKSDGTIDIAWGFTEEGGGGTTSLPYHITDQAAAIAEVESDRLLGRRSHWERLAQAGELYASKQAGFVSTPDGRIRREEDGTYECPVCGKPWKGHGFIMGNLPVCSKESSRKQGSAGWQISFEFDENKGEYWLHDAYVCDQPVTSGGFLGDFRAASFAEVVQQLDPDGFWEAEHPQGYQGLFNFHGCLRPGAFRDAKQATHQEHVKWLMHQYDLTEEEAEKEAQERYEKYPQERERWQASRKQAGFVSTPDGRIRREEDGTYECPVCGKPWKGHGFIMGTVPVCSKESRKQAQAAVTVRPKHVGKEKRLEGWDVIVVHSPTLSKVVTTLPSKTEAVHYAEAYAREAGFYWHKAQRVSRAASLSESDIGQEYIVSLTNGDVFLGYLTNVGATEVEFNGWLWVGRGEIDSLVGASGGVSAAKKVQANDALLGPIGSIVTEISDPKLSGAELNPYVQQLVEMAGQPDLGEIGSIVSEVSDPKLSGAQLNPYVQQIEQILKGAKKQAGIGPGENVIKVWQGTNKGIPGAFTLTEGGHGAGGEYILYFKRGDGGSDDPSTPGFTDWRIVGRGDDPDALLAKHDDDHLGNIYGQKKASKRYETAKQVVETGQAGEIEGHALDSTSAKALIAGYEALTPENQARFDQVPLDQLMKIIWKNVARKRTATRLNAPEEGWAIIEDVLSAGRVEDVRRGGPSSNTQITIAVPGGNEYHFTHLDSLGWRWASQSIYGKWEAVSGAGCDVQGFKITDEDHVAYLDAVLQGRG